MEERQSCVSMLLKRMARCCPGVLVAEGGVMLVPSAGGGRSAERLCREALIAADCSCAVGAASGAASGSRGGR